LHKQGNKSDKIDARKLAERLRLGDLKPVSHGETGIRMLRELARSYLTVVKDLSRVQGNILSFRSREKNVLDFSSYRYGFFNAHSKSIA
jgi:Transposase